MNEPVIFNLTKSDLAPILRNIAGYDICDFDIGFRDRPPNPESIMTGIGGHYLVPTFTWQRPDNRPKEITLFVRRRNNLDIGHAQEFHYRFLEKQGIPVPHLYGTLRDAENREVIFVENVRPVGTSREDFYRDPAALSEFLQLIARFNSVKMTVEYGAGLGWNMPERKFVMNWHTWLLWSISVLDYLEREAAAGHFNDAIRDYCAANGRQIRRLKEMILKLCFIIPAFPTGYIHDDLHPGNIGWRDHPKELVVFDFEDVILGTRFFDIAVIIGGWNAERDHPTSQSELADIYLNTYCECSGVSIDKADFIREISLVWFGRLVDLWEYLPAEHLNAPAYDSGMPGTNRQERLDLTLTKLKLSLSQLDYINSLL